MRILVTGAAGFIGSHTVDALLLMGHQVVGFDNFDPFYDVSIKYDNLSKAIQHRHFLLFEGDLRDKSSVTQLFKTGSFDLVIHLAAKAGVRPSISDPQSYFEVNLQGTVNLLECMKEHGCKKMVFASSSSVYGNQVKVPFSETDSVDFPISPYAASKKAGELLCHTYHHLFGFDIFCLRFFTVYGPRQRPEMAIAKFVRQILNGENYHTVWER